MNLKRKGQVIGQLQALIGPLVGIGIVLALGFLIIAQAKTQVASIEGLNASGYSATHPGGTAAWNATEKIQSSMDDIPGWLPIIIVTVIGALLLGLISYFRSR